jgi:hypothetical protein
MKSGYSVWLGALVRLDYISGDDKQVTFVVPPDVTIHKTPILKANQVFLNQADRLLKPSYFQRVDQSAYSRTSEELGDLDAADKTSDEDEFGFDEKSEGKESGDTEEEDEDMKQAYNVLDNLEQHEINLHCYDHKLVNYEIVVDGLGWISVQGKGMANFILHLPPHIGYTIRDDPMRPYMAQDQRLQKYTGNTINSNTKRNKQKSSKFAKR